MKSSRLSWVYQIGSCWPTAAAHCRPASADFPCYSTQRCQALGQFERQRFDTLGEGPLSRLGVDDKKSIEGVICLARSESGLGEQFLDPGLLPGLTTVFGQVPQYARPGLGKRHMPDRMDGIA